MGRKRVTDGDEKEYIAAIRFGAGLGIGNFSGPRITTPAGRIFFPCGHSGSLLFTGIARAMNKSKPIF
jgi:hypothetical protein